ncbi:Small auxin-up RNA [Dillenia turbinata]|uniref:Small auxin-up RNA n=1 Tax=Dillenia turbinata TaxID=194707 RepID=A0AAN8UZ00_9MAGN
MRKIRGFKLGKRLVRVCKWITRRRFRSGYRRLEAPACKKGKISNLFEWGRRRFNIGTKCLSFSKPGSGYADIGEEPVEKKPPVPKGHLAVYVAPKDDDPHRFLVPVIYFNHPLFSELLRDAEEEFGYHHPGGITIPCRISEFERIQTRIAAVEGCRKMMWKRH